MKNFAALASAVVAMAAASAPAQAQTSFAANLDSAQEVLGSASPGIGTGAVTLAADEQSLTYTLTLTNFVAPGSSVPDLVNMVHIHDGFAGQNGPVAFGIFDTSALPPLNGQPQMVDASGPFTFTGTWRATDKVDPLTPGLVSDLKAGGLYFNVHTDAYMLGASRGQILAAVPAVVPEPAPAALLAVGGLPLAVFVARRRRAA